MKTLSELLRAADPLGCEPRWSARDRSLSRQAVLDAPRLVEQVRHRAIAIVSAAAVALIAIAIVGAHWSRTTVDVLAAVRFEVRLAEDSPAAGLREAPISISGGRAYLHQQVIVTNSDIAQAEVVQGGLSSSFSVVVTFNAEGAAKMRQATQNHVGRPVAILIDGEVVMAPVVRSPISTSAVISGNYTRAEAERIAAGIRGR